MPDQVVTAVNASIFSFLWNKKPERLARVSVTQRTSCGGLGLIDVQRKIQSLHVLWVRHLVTHPTCPSTFFFRLYLSAAFAGPSVQQILLLPEAFDTALKLLPSFYRSVMAAWFGFHRRLEQDQVVLVGERGPPCPLGSLTASYAYEQLSCLNRPDHRCLAKYRSWNLSVHWQTVWSNLQLWRLPMLYCPRLIVCLTLAFACRLLVIVVHPRPSFICSPYVLLHCDWLLGTSPWYVGFSTQHLS